MLFIRFKSSVIRLFSSQIGRETLGSMGLIITNMGLVFLSSVFLARILGPIEYGVYSYVYALVFLLSIPSQFGLPSLVVRETARGMAEEDYSLVSGIWRWSGRITSIISVVVMTLTGAIIFFTGNSLASKRLDTLLYGLLLVPLIALGNLRGASLRGLRKILTGQFPELILRPALFVILLAGCLWIFPIDLSSGFAIGLNVIASALAFGVGVLLLWQVTPIQVRQSEPRYMNRIWLISALPMAFNSGMQVINRQAAILMQGFFLNDGDIGIFRVAIQVATVAGFGLQAINLVIAPRIASLFAQGNIQKIQRLVTRSAQLILILNLIITVGFVVLGKPFLIIIFGIAYVDAYIPLLIMLGGQLINSGVGSVGLLLNMTNLERINTKALTISVVVNLLLNIMLIPRLAIVGSAIAGFFSIAWWNISLWYAVRDKLNINSLAFYVKNKTKSVDH